jgi:hypothetical protein
LVDAFVRTPDLQEVREAWPKLSEAERAAVRLLVAQTRVILEESRRLKSRREPIPHARSLT